MHAFSAYEASLDLHNLLFWNFSASPVELRLELTGSSTPPLRGRQLSSDVATASVDENARLRSEGVLGADQGTPQHVKLAPIGITFWELLAANR